MAHGAYCIRPRRLCVFFAIHVCLLRVPLTVFIIQYVYAYFKMGCCTNVYAYFCAFFYVYTLRCVWYNIAEVIYYDIQ